MSLLLAHGHPGAGGYSIGRLWQEAGFVISRVQAERAATVLLFRQAIASIPNMAVAPESTQEVSRDFSAMIGRLIGD